MNLPMLLSSVLMVVYLPLFLLTNALPLPEEISAAAATTATNSRPVGFNSSPVSSTYKDSVGLIPVWSTVIPVTNPFGSSKLKGNSRLYPYSYSSSYARKLRLFEKSSKPNSPVRLITKHSALKGTPDGHD